MRSITKDKTFFEVKVVSRNIISDFVQSIRNFLGMEMTGYSNIIEITVKELLNKIKKKGKANWFKIDIEQIANSGIIISVYGEYK